MELEIDDYHLHLPEFFKVFVRQHTLHRMLIPREFVEYMGRRKTGSAELVRSGRIWRLELIEVGNEFYFADGWEDFLKDNLVRDGEFMFFKLHGDLKFSVVIYDESMCEVQVCEQRGNCVENIREEGNGVETVMSESLQSLHPEGTQIADEAKPSFVKGITPKTFVIPKHFLRRHSLKYKSGEMMVLRTSRNSYSEVNIINCPSKVLLSKGWQAFISENCIKAGDICKFELLERLEMKVSLVLREEGSVKKKENVAASKRAADGVETVKTANLRSYPPEVDKATDSVKPSFEKCVTQSSFRIPKAFVVKHALRYKTSETMVLRTSKNSYSEVKLIIEGDHIRLSSGWRAFYNKNCFKEGDFCKFELLDRLEIMVHVMPQEKVNVATSKTIPSERAAEVSQPGLNPGNEPGETESLSPSVRSRVITQLEAELKHLNDVISLSADRLKEVKGILLDLRRPDQNEVGIDEVKDEDAFEGENDQLQ